jgi:GT2 family glycosyltransferase
LPKASILLLNPDTVVEEDTFKDTLGFMDSHPDAGALGVKMVDGKGIYLPESKRSLPTPAVSFFKIFGLSSLFPKSRVFGRYHLGFLDREQTHEIDVLPGAFMLMRKAVLDKIGWLDETFFMYGEDIDLSYRVQLGGYKNYYFPKGRIIHYKGESTKKGSMNYVKIFYQAMIIFAGKHFSKRNASLYAFFINIAVYLRAAIALVMRAVKALALPLLDAMALYGGMYAIKEFWASSIKNAPEYYSPVYMHYVVPGYIVLWLLAVYFNGGYDRPLRTYRAVRGVVIGTLLIATAYAFLDETLRFSRGMIVVGAVWAAIAMLGIRYLLEILRGRKLAFGEDHTPRIVIAGSYDETKRALSLLTQAGVDNRFIGFVSPLDNEVEEDNYLGNVASLADVQEMYEIDEIIFCSRDVAVKTIIDYMEQMGPEMNYKILPENSPSIIGSNSKNTAGDLYAIDINLAISTDMSRRNKRLFDMGTCLLTLAVFPVSLLVVKEKGRFINNWVSVLFGNKTWVGYVPTSDVKSSYWLPRLLPGVLSPLDAVKKQAVNDATKNRLNLLYAKDYSVYKDIKIAWKGLRSLGN